MATDGHLRAAILGCGRIAGAFAEVGARPSTHAQALRATPAFRLVAVADADRARAKTFAARWHADDVHDATDLASAGLDLVTVATSDASHAADLAALLAGSHPPRLVVMEKPLCVTAVELSSIERLAQMGQTTVVVNHPRRFDPRHRSVRELIASRRLGPLVGVRWVYYGGWLHNGVHVIDTLRMLLGGEVEPTDIRPGCEDRAGDPCLDGDFRCDAWPQARILIESHPQSAFQLFEGEIRMRDGRIRLNDFGNEMMVDSVRVNAIGERELKDPRRIGEDAAPAAIEVLYGLAARSLACGDDEIIACSGLAQASATMRTLFDVKARVGV